MRNCDEAGSIGQAFWRVKGAHGGGLGGYKDNARKCSASALRSALQKRCKLRANLWRTEHGIGSGGKSPDCGAIACAQRVETPPRAIHGRDKDLPIACGDAVTNIV